MTSPDETQVLPTAQTPGISISRDEIGTLPVRRFDGPIHLISRDENIQRACEELRRETLLGFDIETRPSFRVGETYPPALIQLAGARDAYIFQLHNLAAIQPVLDILAEPAITKAGVALADDLKKLRGTYTFEPAGFIEIATLAREQGFKQTGLRALCALLFGFRMSKREQRSNWAARVLTRGQIVYAATDAWASRELYLRLTQPA
jgi:ribonuclease D